MTAFDLEAIVADAMLAPSAHNTQPARWSHEGEAIGLWADLDRRLPVGDPTERDFDVSCGAAVEGTVLALAARGLGAKVDWIRGDPRGSYRPVARINLTDRDPDPEDRRRAGQVAARITHRTGFTTAPVGDLSGWSDPNAHVVTAPEELDWLARRIDRASARIMRAPAFRAELLHWMRLNPRAPNYHRDGLNAEVLALDRVSAALVPAVLGTGIYPILSRLGLGPALSGEAKRSRASTAIALFHWPDTEPYLEAGRAFYRLWLDATARGLAGWPAAALADDPETASAIADRFALPPGRVLVNALRLGRPVGVTPSRTRLSLEDVLITP